MDIKELEYQNLLAELLKPYEKRAPNISVRFLRWFLEEIFRLDSQDADDASVDEAQDKGIDGIYVNEVTETIYVFQAKTKQKVNSKLGDSDLKEFYGSLEQFRTPESVQIILDGNANEKLKSALRRTRFVDKLASGYAIEGVFCTNISSNIDATDFLDTCENISLYDADRIVAEHVDTGDYGGVTGLFKFDVSDTEVIDYQATPEVKARIFLANALQLLHMDGIADSSLFERNVRLSLGNTKVNKELISSIKEKSEHHNFPLYHNGITLLCEQFVDDVAGELGVENYMVVNGAQSITALNTAKNSITDDLKILVKAVAVQGDSELSDKITRNSNNQNAIKPRDMRSNHGIQQRLKAEVAALKFQNVAYEVKRGEKHDKNVQVLSNEDAGLMLLALDIGEPWSCHQKYKIMDESHSKIFGRPEVNGIRIITLYMAFKTIYGALDEFDDQSFGQYNLTKFFLASTVCEIIKDDAVGKSLFSNFQILFDKNTLNDFLVVFSDIAATTVHDLGAEVEDLNEKADGKPDFDHKSELKSPSWCRSMTSKLKAAYKKDVKRKKAESISDLLKDIV